MFLIIVIFKKGSESDTGYMVCFVVEYQDYLAVVFSLIWIDCYINMVQQRTKGKMICLFTSCNLRHAISIKLNARIYLDIAFSLNYLLLHNVI